MPVYSIKPIDRALSDATTQGQSGPGSDSHEGVLHILQSSSNTGTSLSDCLELYPGYSSWILFQAIQFIQTVLIQPTQFSISIDFVYTQLNVKTVLY